MVLVGDHKQLPPTVMSQNVDATRFNRSLFERMIDTGNKAPTLDTQYRMVSDLSLFASQKFYGGKLKDGGKHFVPQALKKMSFPTWFIDIEHGKD